MLAIFVDCHPKKEANIWS